MSTTKPARNRPNNTHTPTRIAPAYKRLTVEQYAALDEDQKRKHDAHLDVDAISDALEYARLDARAFGFPSSVALTDTPRHTDEEKLNAVEAASLRAEPAHQWLSEHKEAIAQLTRVARLARFYYGFDPERGKDQNARVNNVPVCLWCGEPAPSGRSQSGQPLRHDVPLPSGGKAPIHADTCYHKVKRQAMAEDRTIQIILAERSNAPTRPLPGSGV